MIAHHGIALAVEALSLSNNTSRDFPRTRSREWSGHMNIATQSSSSVSLQMENYSFVHLLREFCLVYIKHPVGWMDSLLFDNQIDQSDVGLSLTLQSHCRDPRGGAVVASNRDPGRNHILFGIVSWDLFGDSGYPNHQLQAVGLLLLCLRYYTHVYCSV